MPEYGPVTVTRDGDVAVLTMNNPPVNALGLALRQGLMAALDALRGDASVKAIVLAGTARAFSGGADITEFGGAMQDPNLRQVITAVEDMPVPVVAAMQGVALGGGLELALGCHARVAWPAAKMGLPEVKLGLLPGAGGTQRLPRVAGVEKALSMIVTGTPIDAADAQAAGVVDLVTDGPYPGAAVAYARTVTDRRRVRDREDKLESARADAGLIDRVAAPLLKASGAQAPRACVESVRAAVQMPFDDGAANERRLFEGLVTGDESRAQRHAFFAEREAQKAKLPPGTEPRPVHRAAVIGAGTMGGGIAMNFANAGIPVTIVEVKQDALDRGLGVIRKNYERTAARGGITAADVEKRMSLISGSLDMNALAPVDMVIEAVFERMDIKKDIFTKLDAICKPGAILATNTSALNIDEIASVTQRPEAVIGLHFFSPANVMKLLEVVRAEHTSKSVIATSMKLAKKIGKIAALVGVCPGFVGNRILGQRQREAQKLMFEGAMPWDIDRVLYDFGFPMGPFAMSDLAGLDIGWVKESSKGETIRDALCELDRRGQKTGAGYYDYDENRVAHPSAVTEKIIQDFVARSGVNARTITDEEILERCLYPMVNEGAKILEEGMAIRASDIDVIWENGYGWPVYRGGPMWWGDQIGLDKVLAGMKTLQAQMGDLYKPAALLEKMVAEGKSFTRG